MLDLSHKRVAHENVTEASYSDRSPRRPAGIETFRHRERVAYIDPSTKRVQYGGVGKQHQLIIPEAVRALAAAELFPGETMLALCEFWVGVSPPRLLALTEGSLRYLQLNRSNSGFERTETKSLDRVTSFTTSYVENSRLTPDHHILELRWDDERDPERLRSPYREAQESIDAFTAVMARRQSRSSGGRTAES